VNGWQEEVVDHALPYINIFSSNKFQKPTDLRRENLYLFSKETVAITVFITIGGTYIIMAKRRKEDTDLSSSQKQSFAEAFHSKLSECCKYDAPEPVLCSTGNTLLDTIIGGGLLTGKYHVFAAPAHSGKSTTCIRTIATFLNTYKDGLALWVDGEQATPEPRLMQLGIPYYPQLDASGNPIVDEDSGLYKPQLTSTGDVIWDDRFFRIPNNITLESAFELIDKCIEVKINYGAEKNPLLVVFDSLDSLPTQKEAETVNVDSAMAVKAKVLGYYMKRYLFKLQQYNICFIFISHIGQKISMQGPYEAYDGRMGSLKNFTITGGKAMQFYPSNMIFFRSRLGNTIDKELEDMGISSGFIVEATTLKAKNFSFNLTVPLVFHTLKGFDEYPTRFLNMKKNDWFGGAGVSRYLPEYPDDKFNSKTFFTKLSSDPSFVKKVDESWTNYLHQKYSKYKALMSSITESNQNLSGVVDDVNEEVLTSAISSFMNNGNDEDVVEEGSAPTVNNTVDFGPETEASN